MPVAALMRVRMHQFVLAALHSRTAVAATVAAASADMDRVASGLATEYLALA